MAKQFNALTGTPVSFMKRETIAAAKQVQTTGVLGRRSRRQARRADRAL